MIQRFGRIRSCEGPVSAKFRPKIAPACLASGRRGKPADGCQNQRSATTTVSPGFICVMTGTI
jgi:hypothetical protein